ncbi:outer membrane beta-barrel protein [Sungkyunkwania multivorans]|uniref:Outer membrane beta-barrel protein n=1 Tax=Sungkyunkwania multivorans TaxID=1173618 RepID=A0ABW3CUP9_9FLAO
MKNYILLASMFASTMLFAQIDFGVKAGLNYSQNGKLRISQIGDAAQNIVEGSDGKVGFHLGGFARIGLASFYLRPELVYTKTKSSYESQLGKTDYDLSKIDVPILLGYKLIGPLSVFAGPSFQYILDNDLDDVTLGDVKNDVSVGLNVGAAVQIGNIGLDARYERGFSNNEASLIGDTLGTIDSRPSQIIFSLSLNL